VFSFWLFATLGLVTRENTPLLFSGQSTTFGYISAQLPSEAYLIGHAFLERIVSFCYNLVIDEVEFDERIDPQIIGEAITSSVKHSQSLSLEDLTDDGVGYKSSGGAVDTNDDFSYKVKLIAAEGAVKCC